MIKPILLSEGKAKKKNKEKPSPGLPVTGHSSLRSQCWREQAWGMEAEEPCSAPGSKASPQPDPGPFSHLYRCGRPGEEPIRPG